MSRIAWIIALIAVLLAVLFYLRLKTANIETKLQSDNAELTQVELKSLKQQLYAERILAERRIADLANSAPKSDALAFAHLSPPEAGATQPSAMVTWIPARQSGVLFAEALPPPSDEEELRLWLEETNSGPISAGVIAVGPNRLTKVEFKSAKPLGLGVRFTVTRERKGNTGKPSGPVLMSGAP